MNNGTTTADDVDAYIAGVLGPKTMPLSSLVPLTAVYALIFATGIVGNVCTCIVISRNQYMQTPTNCYLFNLAIADMLTLMLAMPPELYTLWHQYPWQLGTVCCWLRGMVPEATAYASILTIVTFSSERYVAICRPLRTRARSTLARAVRNIAVIWAVSALCAFPYAFYTQVNHLESNLGTPLLESAWCGFPFNKPDWRWEVLMLCSTLLFFVLPLSLITGMYALIAHALHRSRDLHRSTSESAQCRAERERSKAQSRRVVVRMLAAVVLAFFVCWAPFHAQRLLFLYVSLHGQWTDTTKRINDNLFTLAGCFYYFNSTINPILYSVMSNRFRVAFREKLCAGPPSLWCICCCCFCCVRDFEKRSIQGQHNTPALCRNSNSSSMRSSFNHVNNNNRRALAVDFDPKQGAVTLSCVHLPSCSSTHKFGPNLTVPETSSSSSAGRAQGEQEELAEELDLAIRPELDRLEEKGGDCISCTNCSLLFPPRVVEETSTTELSTDEREVRESLV